MVPEILYILPQNVASVVTGETVFVTEALYGLRSCQRFFYSVHP